MSKRGMFLALSLGVGLLGPIGAAAAGCVDGATTGKRVVLKTRAVADPEASQGFVTGKGWQVKLSRAAISTGAFYYFDGAPAVVRAGGGARRARLAVARVLGLGAAWAHPGHYAPGEALGQVLSGASFDLLSGPVDLARGEGLSGAYRSATFSFAPGSPGAAQGSLGEAVALIEGQAIKGESAVYFRFSATFDEVNQNLTEGHVPGCSFDPADVEQDGTVTVTIKPSPWFNLVDFGSIAPGSPDAPTEVARGEKAHVELALGLAQLTAYRFSYSP